MTNFKGKELLGLKVRERVTGIEGIVTSISFDLYGCIMGLVTPSAKNKTERVDSHWFDMKRLQILSKKPVMKCPDFEIPEIGGGR